MSQVRRDEALEPVEREVPQHRRRRTGRKPWAIEVKYPMSPPFGEWLRYQRYETREQAEQALATNQRKARRVLYRLVGPGGEIVTSASAD